MAFTTKLIRIWVSGIRRYSLCININDAYIVSAARTPIGSFQGKLSSLSAIQLATDALSSCIEKSCVGKEDIQEVVLGCVMPHGLGQDPARQVALFTGLPTSVVGSTVNKLGASGMKALTFGCQLLTTNTQELVAVGGTESLSNAPYILRRKCMRLGNICIPDAILHDSMIDVFEQIDITAFAENTAKEYKITRKDQDDYALRSYNKATLAEESGIFSEEIVSVRIKNKEGEEEIVCADEELKRINIETFREMMPEMGRDGTITRGNSSCFSDGATMMLLASGNYVLKKNLKPLAKIVAYADGALDPKQFCLAPLVAIRKALVKANLTVEHINLWEINETFAVTVLVNASLLKLKLDKVNVHGGSISLGHPFAATGARLILHLANCLQPGELGCAAISHGSGGGTAVIIEKMG